MKVITALGNPKTNEKLKMENNFFEIIGNDIQYQEGIIEILEKEPEIDLIIISELLSGEIGFKELINRIKKINKKIEVIVILKKEDEEIKNYLISKGIFNFFYNNKITNDELIEKIRKIYNIKKENEINEEIKTLKKIILEKNQINKIEFNTNIIYKYLIKIKNKFLNKKIFSKKIEKNENQIVSIVGPNGIGKSTFSAILAKIIKNKKVLLIDFDVFNHSINSIFNTKKRYKENKNTKNNVEKLIIRVNKNIDLLCAIDMLFDENYNVEKNEIKNLIDKFVKKYDLIIIDTTSETFFKFTKEILEKSDKIIFLSQANLIELKKSRNLLDLYINKWNIEKEKIQIVFNKIDINSIDDKVLKTLFSDFKILEKIKVNKNFNLIINNNLKINDKKIRNKFEKIIERCNL